ncbi:metallophosphoesterase family protein [Flavobacteriaceae bacterium TK19130]|nr:metallophosphoesterase family protein [Thermobacterium salinum]
MDKKIIDIGEVDGPILLFGGVYSNLQALRALRSYAEENNIPPSNCICNGDIIGYCAQPEETLQFFKEWGARSIVGNVEVQLRDGAEDCGCDFRKGSRCDAFSQQWYPFAKSKLSEDSMQFLNELPDHISFRYAGQKVLVVHGSFQHVSDFIFKSTPWEEKEATFNQTGSDIIIAGHCGLPFAQNKENTLWLNPGVIGMPANDGSPKVWFATLMATSEGIRYAHLRLEYDHETAHALMIQEKLPKEYAQTLLTGIWDNTEILPATETAQQGVAITP